MSTADSLQLRSLEDAAAYLRVSVRTIRYWIAQGRLPGYRVGPMLLRVDQADLDALIQRKPVAG